jgi:flagellar biosynthesis/type III secretory pathway chaperone
VDTLELVETLKREAECYRGLVKLAAEQKTILVSGKLKGLQENVRAQEKIMFSLGPLADTRKRLLEAAGKSLGLKPKKVSDLTAGLPEEQGQPILNAAKELMDSVHDLDAVNKVNGRLLENAQAYAKFTIEAFRGKAAERATFTAQGPTNSGTSIFNKVV